MAGRRFYWHIEHEAVSTFGVMLGKKDHRVPEIRFAQRWRGEQELARVVAGRLWKGDVLGVDHRYQE